MEHFNADENKIGFKTHCTETATGKRLIYHALFVQKSVFQQKLFFKLLCVHTTVGGEFYTTGFSMCIYTAGTQINGTGEYL